MRNVYLVLLLAGLMISAGCATKSPATEPLLWMPTNPERAVVVFVDDHIDNSLERDEDLVLQLQRRSVSELQQYQYDVTESDLLTQTFLNHAGRRTGSEVADSLAMLEGWGFAVAHVFSLHSENTKQYRKVWLSVNSTLYDIQEQRVIQRWEQPMLRHVVVAADCNQACTEQSILPRAEELMVNIAERTHRAIREYHQPAEYKEPPARKPPPKPPAKIPDDVPEPRSSEKGQWNTINF